MKIELKCAICGATLDDRNEHGQWVVEPCEECAHRNGTTVGLGSDEVSTLRRMWNPYRLQT